MCFDIKMVAVPCLLNVSRLVAILTTVKLGYDKIGYNKLPAITNNFFQYFQSQIYVYYIIQLGYNEFRL
jgi:hypothetical protein